MVRVLLIFIATLFFSNGYGQIEEGDFTFSTDVRFGLDKEDNLTNSIGFGLEYAVSDVIGLNYSLSFGDGFIHAPASLAITAFIIYISEYIDETAFYAIFIPEGVTFNLKMNDFLSISPYINPLGLEYYWDESIEDPVLFTGAFGFKLKAIINNSLLVMPFIEIQQQYNVFETLTRGGMSIGLKF